MLWVPLTPIWGVPPGWGVRFPEIDKGWGVPRFAEPVKAAGMAHGGQACSLAYLTTSSIVGILANMAAQLITRFKNVNPDGSILELVVWKVDTPVPPTEHGYKYRAVYVLDGQRIVGFDNERGKGDHRHLDGKELPYTFTSVEQLVEDFIAAVSARRTS